MSKFPTLVNFYELHNETFINCFVLLKARPKVEENLIFYVLDSSWRKSIVILILLMSFQGITKKYPIKNFFFWIKNIILRTKPTSMVVIANTVEELPFLTVPVFKNCGKNNMGWYTVHCTVWWSVEIFLIGQNRSTNQRSGMILEVQIQIFRALATKFSFSKNSRLPKY